MPHSHWPLESFRRTTPVRRETAPGHAGRAASVLSLLWAPACDVVVPLPAVSFPRVLESLVRRMPAALHHSFGIDPVRPSFVWCKWCIPMSGRRCRRHAGTMPAP
eukprot:4417700-Prymnesium_polylepis.2